MIKKVEKVNLLGDSKEKNASNKTEPQKQESQKSERSASSSSEARHPRTGGRKEDQQLVVNFSTPAVPEVKYPHLRSKIWIQFVHDTNQYHPSQIPPFLPVYLGESLENKTQNVTFEFNTYWIWKYMLEKQLDQSTSMYEEWGVDTSSDELKEMLTESNPYLVAVTMVVSSLHSVFEILAVKNDISFW
eukprot:CAMPEP_0176472384 /NCGR_PEP_ID=MMETSP0127-20121128/41712_1 /TAXON_ID=938130 /ORGANISM="Platyophrya macrostoma, Strain WH" /LENGTH=187 /DNA_ID=CAMNT_0017867245 /DNA_START=134 /DNA_END=694 /DNA_ORIENTATION=-